MKFYIRLRTVPLFWINKCLVFNGWNKPYWCNTTSIWNDLEYKQIKL